MTDENNHRKPLQVLPIYSQLRDDLHAKMFDAALLVYVSELYQRLFPKKV
jgi:hypothetical protein